ncbi:hypothetical protein M9Y10_042923 [Tritrichomonas musculus]|uniref:DUF3447 domain-containing protein n=1 Tax=Tritrichomonas musculus TaxID=1915356 RepID=A0ABR2JYG7_9EUKA
MALNTNTFTIGSNNDTSKGSFDDKWTINITPGSRSCNFNFLKYLPPNFLISTKDSSEKFNVLILENISTAIRNFLIVNPDSREYHLDIQDSSNALCKVKQMCQGESVTISEDIKTNFNEIIKAMEFDQSPNFDFLKIDAYERFVIETKKRKYRCNIYGVLSSSVIRNIISKSDVEEEDEEERYYFYDIEDPNEEFMIIVNIFNFQDVKLTEENFDVLKKFASELEIECLLDILDKFNNKDEYRETTIDEQETIIEKIDGIFDPLFHIKENTIDSTFSEVIGTKFSKSEEYVNELASIIVTIAQTKADLQDSLIDLMVKLNEEGPDNMKSLLHFVVSKSMFLFTKRMDSAEADLIYPFVYRMYKRNLIPKDQIIFKINESHNKLHNFCISWFLPEVLEADSYYIKNYHDEDQGKVMKSYDYLIKYKNEMFFTKDLINMSEYFEMRDKNENDDDIARVIKNDDINQLQALVSNNPDMILDGTIKSNIFEPFKVRRINYLNYAAFNGSINCFKYLLLNKVEIDELTYELSIIGGNFEIVRIVNNAKDNDYSSIDFVLSGLKQAIKYHQDELFDWIFDSNYQNIKGFKDFESLINCSIESFNYHSLIQIFGNNDLNFLESSIKFSSFLELAAEKGSCYYLILLMNLFDISNTAKVSASLISTICSDNIFIFNQFHKSIKEEDLIEVILLSLKNDCEHISNYILDSNEIRFDKKTSQKILACFVYILFDNRNDNLFDRIIKLCSYDSNILKDVMLETINFYNNKFHKKIIGLFNNNENAGFYYSEIINELISKNKYEVTKYIIDQKYPVDFHYLVNEIQMYGNMDIKLFQLIMDSLSPEFQNKMLNILDNAIPSENYPLIQHILKSYDFISENALIEATKIQDDKLMEKILEKRSDPSFINANTDRGNALYWAVIQTNKFAIKKLLSIPGINPNIIVKDDPEIVTPFILSGLTHLFNIFLDFYGENIKDKEPKWQLEIIVKNLFDRYEKNEILFPNMLPALKERFLQIMKLNVIDLNVYSTNDSVLTFAIKRSYYDLVRELLQNETVDVNLTIPYHKINPLSFAIYDMNMFILLINHPKIDINYIDYDYKTIFHTNSDKIKSYLFIKNERMNYCKNMINNSNLDYLSTLNITESLFLRESVNNDKYDDYFNTTFDFTFPNFSSRNFDLPIESHELITGLFCEKFILDFKSNLITVDITKNYYHIENKASFNIKILNKDDTLSKKINVEIEFLNKVSKSTKIPLKLEYILNPENGWLFDDKLKIQVEVISSFKRIKSNGHPPSLPQNLAENIFGIRFRVPISMFDLNKFDNIIKFQKIEIGRDFSLSPIIFYYFEEEKINIHTYFLYTGRGRFSFKNLIIYYENKDQNKNFLSMFSDEELCAYVKMPVLTLEKSMEKDGFSFIYGNQTVLQLCFKIQMRN